MRNIICILILISLSRPILGQTNLVPNPSFETFIGCPLSNTFGNDFYSDWFAVYDSPDYFNTCDTIYQGVPSNFWGYQPAFDGNAYVGLGTFLNDTMLHGREYMQVQLTSVLKQDTTYCASFYVNPANDNQYYCNDIGLLFTDTAFTSGVDLIQFGFLPQISNSPTNYLGDTTIWYRVSGQFIAQGGEKYLTIGNFKTNQSSTFGNIGGISSISYYYIDSVTVCNCPTTLGIHESLQEAIKIFPNPITNYFSIQNSNKSNLLKKMSLQDLTGKTVQIFDVKSNATAPYKIDHISSGLYFLKITFETFEFFKKVIIEN